MRIGQTRVTVAAILQNLGEAHRDFDLYHRTETRALLTLLVESP